MEAKTNINKRIICLLIIVSLIGSIFIGYISNAAGDDEVTYKVEQITSSNDINSKNLYQYIIVYEDDAGDNYALGSTLSSSGNYYMSRENYVDVEITNSTIKKNSETNILWNFTKSRASVLENGDYPVISSVVEMYSGRKQLKLSSGGNGGATGIRYSGNGNGFTFEEAGDNTFYIYENNCETSNKYLGFDEGFKKSSEDNATSFKIYKVIKEYNYHSSEYLSSDEIASMEDVKVSKTVSPYENYDDTAIAEVKLKTNGTDYIKVCDIVLILDDSTSVYTEAPEDTSKTRAQIIREDALLFAEEILGINPDNRISVIKFGRNITNEDVVDDIGFSNNINSIEEMIGGDKQEVSYGTDYTAAFKKANEILEKHSDPNHGKVVIFISDGLPNYFNNVSYSVFSDTSDATGEATNWINYITETPLMEAQLMAQTNTAIYTVGSLKDNTQLIQGSDGWYMPAQTTRDILTGIATEKANFYDFDKIETELEEILDKIAKEFCYYPTNANVVDNLTTDVNLLTKTVTGYVPEMIFKRGDVEVEKITFNEDGTEAYTSLNPGVNIMNGNKFEGMYISFDGDSVRWYIGDLYKYEYSLEFPIYLNNTVDLYGEGNNRPTGDYNVSETTQLVYTDVTGEETTKDFEPAELPWKNPTDESSMTDEVDPEEPKPEPQTATNVSTGDNTLTLVGIVMFIASGLALYKRKLLKARKHNKNIIY